VLYKITQFPEQQLRKLGDFRQKSSNLSQNLSKSSQFSRFSDKNAQKSLKSSQNLYSWEQLLLHPITQFSE